MRLVIHIILFGWVYVLIAQIIIGLIKSSSNSSRSYSYSKKDYGKSRCETSTFYDKDSSYSKKRDMAKSNPAPIIKEEKPFPKKDEATEKIVLPPDYDGETISSLEALLTGDESDVVDETLLEDSEQELLNNNLEEFVRETELAS